MAIPSNSILREIVDQHRKDLALRVQGYLRDLSIERLVEWERLPKLIGTGAFNCNAVSVSAGEQLNQQGFTCTWQTGDLAFEGQTIFRVGDVAHQWLVMPGTDGENVVLDFTVGYHLWARKRIEENSMRVKYDPFWGSPCPELVYTVHHYNFWEHDHWGLQVKVNSPTQVLGTVFKRIATE